MRFNVTGQLNLLEENTSADKILGFDLAKKLTDLTGLDQKFANTIQIDVADGVVTLFDGSISTKRAVLILVSGPGTVLMKHNGNSAGADISGIYFLEGNIGAITVETAATQDMTVDYLILG